MFQLQTGQYLCVFIAHGKYGCIINTEFAISIMSIHQLNYFHSQSEIIFTNDGHTILRGLSSIFALFHLFEKHVN